MPETYQTYQQTIREEAAKLGLAGQVDPRHVEAWMRLEWGVLDARPTSDFRRFVVVAREMERAEPGCGETLARSYGL